jgi:16S rRNA (guanine1207-N2)-methyltransferase
MSHYFIADDTLADNERTATYAFGGHAFTFTANAGLFSPDRVDPATDLLLKTLPPLSGSMLDLGCGYGVIGIVLGKAYGLTVTMSDINARALRYAKQNAGGNGVAAAIIESDGFDAVSGCFDTVTLNPPIHAGKDVVYRMYEQSLTRLAPGGWFFIVIQEKHGAKSSIRKLTDVYGRCDILHKKKGYYVIQCTNYKQPEF